MKRMYLVFGLVLVMGLASCGGGEDSEVDPMPETKGDIFGSVNLFDEATTMIDQSGMTVTAEGTTSSASATTDAEGEFTLENVPFGTYTLVYEKSGYGTFKRFNIEHEDIGTIITGIPSLGQKSTTSITSLTVDSSMEFPVILRVTTDPEGNVGNTRYIRFFFSTSPDVSSDTYENVLETFIVNSAPYNFNLSAEALAALGFPSGATVYARCYGESFWGNNYEDPETGNSVYPNVNPTSPAAVSFVIP